VNEIVVSPLADYVLLRQTTGNLLYRNVLDAAWATLGTGLEFEEFAIGVTVDGASAYGDLPAGVADGLYTLYPFTLVGLSPSASDTAGASQLLGVGARAVRVRGKRQQGLSGKRWA